jgi:hypothetical protein
MNAIRTGVATLVAALAIVSVGTANARPVGGSKFAETEVRARRTDVFNIRFHAGETARVSIRGDGDTDLDLFVYDENGNEICRSTGNYDVEGCSFQPRWTGNFRVEVRNLGGVYNHYRIWAV